MSECKGGLAILDVDTGQIIVEVYCLDIDQLTNAVTGTMKLIDKAVRSKKTPRGPEFYMGYQAAQKAVYQHEKMSATDKLVFSHMLTVMGYGNRVKESQTDIAKNLNINRVTVNRSFQRLRDAGFIVQNKRIKDKVVFNVVENYAAKGKIRMVDHEKLIEASIKKSRETKTGVTLGVVNGGAL